MIIRKSGAELAIMARAGKVVADLHQAVREAVRPGVTTAQLDAIAERVTLAAGAIPSFKGYGGSPHSSRDGIPPFPATLCTSVNEEIVHGIPSPRRVLREGDLIKIDAGAILEGYHADSAATWIVGGDDAAPPEVTRLVQATRAGLWAGLQAARHHARMGDISAAVEAEALPYGYGVVREYVGHGVGRALHEDPQVPNYGKPGRGIKLAAGLVLAIEPMFNLGTHDTRTLGDGWTVVTADGAPSAHWEHTVAITPDGPWVLTAREDETAWPLSEPDRVPALASPG